MQNRKWKRRRSIRPQIEFDIKVIFMKKINCGILLGLATLLSCSANGLDEYTSRPQNNNGNEDARAYYVDATSGNDTNDGTSPDKAWKSLFMASEADLDPGDSLLFKRGEIFSGVLEISAKGTSGEPVVIDSYGDENAPKPVIQGLSTSLYAVRVYNSSYVTVQNLEIVNSGEKLLRRAGLKLECNEYGISKGIVIRGLTVRDVAGGSEGADKYSGGIIMYNTGKERKSCFEDLLIENCHIKNCSRNGITGAGSGGSYCNRNNWFPNRNIIIRNNLLENIPGDGIVPMGCDGALVEYNVMTDENRGGYNLVAAGIWAWSSDNVTIQYNHVVGHQATTDGQAYDCDFNCRNTIVQYNYSSGNHGGFVLFCDDPSATYVNNIGVLEAKVRYNISINDGVRPLKERSTPSALVHFSGGPVEPLIEYNIIHTSPTQVADDNDFLLVRASDSRALVDRPVFRNNVFYAPYKARAHGFMMNGAKATFENNWYLGNIENIPEGDDARTVSEYYQKQVADVDPEGYKGLYNLMEKKEICGQEFLFVKKDAIESFFENMENEK